MKHYDSPEILTKAADARPLDPEAYKKAVFKLKKPHDLRAKYEGKIVLPKNYETQKPFQDPTPRHWRRISIRPEGDLFRLVAFGSGTRILPTDLRLAGLDPSLVLDDLSLDQAKETGAKINAAYLQKFPSLA